MDVVDVFVVVVVCEKPLLLLCLRFMPSPRSRLVSSHFFSFFFFFFFFFFSLFDLFFCSLSFFVTFSLSFFCSLEKGKIVILLNGRYAGHKAVIVRANEAGTKDRPYPHLVVAGVDRAPLKVRHLAMCSFFIC